jgi:hypothetical protein
MEQYSKSGPKIQAPENKVVMGDDTASLKSQIQEQNRLIEELQKEVRRLKQKLDRHADYINRQNHG